MGEWFDWWREEIRVARRKPQKCIECGEKIPIGISYSRVIGVLEGRFLVNITCLTCGEDWEDVFDRDEFLEAIIYGTLLEIISDMIDDGRIEKDEPLGQRWIPRIQARCKEKERKNRRFFCPLQNAGIKATP